MRLFKVFVLALALASVAGCSKFLTYRGPAVTQVLVYKGDRVMHLMHGDKVLRSYPIGLGFAPEGHKTFEGDGRTPEGSYYIDRRNPNSEFHLSVGISYPNVTDRAFAQANGKRPGGDIFIHGESAKARTRGRDWTAGCIAVTNRQIEEIYAMVRDGTPITINP